MLETFTGDDATPPRVSHPVHGHGVVESWRRGGRAAVVRFDDRPLPVEVASRELEVDGDRPGAPGEGAGGPSEDAEEHLRGSLQQDVAAMTLEAMRLGVVPAADLTAYTVGRDEAIARVDADLERAATGGGGAVRAFLGDYGTGKTHLLELAQQRALDAGYVTSLVMLDPEETAPSHPKRVYRSVVRNLRYPDRPFEEGAGLRPLLDRAVASPEALEAFGVDPPLRGHARDLVHDTPFHLYLTPVLAYHRTLTAAQDVPDAELAGDLLLDWLEGHPTISNQQIDRLLSALPGRFPKLYSLLDYRPWARIYGYLLSGLSALARRVGHRGLVVLLDEAEFYALLSKGNRGYARDLFRAWAVATGQAEDDGSGVGGYGIQRHVPPRYGDGSGLVLALAMTPNEQGEAVLREAVPEPLHHALEPLSRDDYLLLAERVCDFYASAWPDWSLPRAVVPALGRVLAELLGGGFVDNPRQAMKFVIEFLDVARTQPDAVPGVVRNLQSTVLF
ncbi:MAG: BREX system ATP-binding domain-containing protein [Myxococcota bacterium]